MTRFVDAVVIVLWAIAWCVGVLAATCAPALAALRVGYRDGRHRRKAQP